MTNRCLVLKAWILTARLNSADALGYGTVLVLMIEGARWLISALHP